MVAKALVALETEIDQLNEDAAMLQTRLKLITTKQKICTDTIQRILISAVNNNVITYPKAYHDSEIRNWS